MSTFKLSYLGQCDKLRRIAQGEQLWQQMLLLKAPVSIDTFKHLCQLEELLDEDETLEDFLADDPSSGLYASFWGEQRCLFIQTSGFEFIFA